jgi:hypothetical protein
VGPGFRRGDGWCGCDGRAAISTTWVPAFAGMSGAEVRSRSNNRPLHHASHGPPRSSRGQALPRFAVEDQTEGMLPPCGARTRTRGAIHVPMRDGCGDASAFASPARRDSIAVRRLALHGRVKKAPQHTGTEGEKRGDTRDQFSPPAY